MGILPHPSKSSPSHPSEEILEEYVFHRLPEALAAPIEEHLLICHTCQDAVAHTDRFVSDLKAAARQPAPAIWQTGWDWRNVGAIARTSLVPVFVLAMLTVIVVRENSQEPLVAPVGVTLSSLRGSNLLSPAPAGKPLHFTIETPDLAFGKAYRVEVVDTSGALVWKGAVTETDGKLAATMPKPLGSGVFWVRLYGADSELLREFGLSAK